MTNPIPLEPGKFYHVYNRGNNRENIFNEEQNYAYFLKLYAFHIGPIADTFAYCLMRNHFHLSVRIKDLTGFPRSDEVLNKNGPPPRTKTCQVWTPARRSRTSSTLTLKRSTRRIIVPARYFNVLSAESR